MLRGLNGIPTESTGLKHNAKEKKVGSGDCGFWKTEVLFNIFGNNYLSFRCFYCYMENKYFEVISCLENKIKIVQGTLYSYYLGWLLRII